MPPAREEKINELILALGVLVRRIRATAPPEIQGLSWTQKSVLSRLEKDGATPIAELARAEGIKPQSMGAAVAALEELGLLERKPHPSDGRQSLMGLTAKGRAIRRNVREAKELWLNQAIAKLEREEQATLFAAGQILKRLVES